ncbi:MAG TPA: AbrB/MazE/SpoVT family DNA-binding domain-containing protein [archaeon]|nr:AbrB/MazE/SpoVT family DNA-binding domain-containing protein [archaeon]
MPEIATLSERGQIVIPQDVREKMHLEPGSKFAVFPIEDSIVLKKIEMPSLEKWDDVLKSLRAEAKKKGITEKDVDRMVQETRRSK